MEISKQLDIAIPFNQKVARDRDGDNGRSLKGL